MKRRLMIATGMLILVTGTVPVSAAYSPWPWDVDDSRMIAWQHGHSRPTPWFAPAGCFIDRRVATPRGVSWQRLYICR